MDYDYNHKNFNLSVDKLKHLEELLGIYGPLNENGLPERVTSMSASYYSKEVKIRMKAIENICWYIKEHRGEYDIEALRKETTTNLQDVSYIISRGYKKSIKLGKPFYLSESEERIVMSYRIKEKEEVYFNPDEEEEFLSEEELESAYGEENHTSVNKRIGSNFIK